jgi:outer membrane protein
MLKNWWKHVSQAIKMPEDLMKKLLMLISLVFLVTLVLPSQSFSMGIEAAVGVWEQSPQGELAFEEFSGLDLLDLEDDLRYDDETRLFARLKIDMPAVIPNIYLMATPMEFDELGQKNVDFKFGDFVFRGNVPFNSELILDHFDVALYYGIPGLETATADLLNVEIGINIRVYDFEGTITGTDDVSGLIVEESEDFTVPVPMIYLGAQLKPIEKLAIEAEVRGLIIGDDKGYSLIGRLKYKVFGPLFLAGGYRYDKIDIEEDDFTLDIDFSGVFAEAGFVF